MRLTKWIDGRIYQNDEQDFDLWEISVIEKLAAYEDAEEQGQLVILPCKVGDTFYYIAGTLCGTEYVASATVAVIEILDAEAQVIDSCGCHHIKFWMSREEAEAALEGDGEDV